MARMEIPNNWREMTEREQNQFIFENSKIPNGWNEMNYEQQKTYFIKNCDCADIIYKDVHDYLMSIPHFKTAYTYLKYRNLPVNDKFQEIHLNTLIRTILDESDQYLRHGLENVKCPALVESCRDFYEGSHLESVQNNHWFFTKPSKYEQDELSYYQQVYYEPTVRSYYNEPCKCCFVIHQEWLNENGEIDEYITEEDHRSCDTYLPFVDMIRCSFIIMLFNILTESKILPYLLYFNNLYPSWSKMLKMKIVEFNKTEECITTKYWKGSHFYYKKIFFGSIYTHELDIPVEILKKRYEWNFDAMICGHPMASHGICKESMDEIQRLEEEYNS